MFEDLNRLFGSGISQPGGQPASDSDQAATRRYFELSSAIEEARKDGDFLTAITAARESLSLLPALVRDTKTSFGRFDIRTSIAVHTGSTLMAVMGDRAGLAELRATLEAIPELRDWLDAADAAAEDVDLVDRIMAAVAHEPGLPQTSLKNRTGQEDGRRLATLASWLEKAKRIDRIRQGSTYALYQHDQVPIPSPQPPRPPRDLIAPSSASAPQASTPRKAIPASEIRLEKLPCLRLPKAPLAWEERQASEGSAEDGEHIPPQLGPSVPRFTVEGDGWRIATEEKLVPSDRPDPAFREAFPTAEHSFWLDPKGRRVGFEDAVAVLRVTDRDGRVTAERGLAHDVYRSDVNTDGTGILFLSRGGVLHGYDHQLAALILERVAECPEYAACADRLGISTRELKNHVRCVGISPDRTRYLFTVVDEAWCFTVGGDPVWGLRFPTQEGWTRVVGQRSGRTGTSTEVIAALQLMALALPVTAEDLARQYRQLAMRWHPDLNPRDPGADERMRQLNLAMELLTGSDLSLLSAQETNDVTYQRILERNSVAIAGGLELTLSRILSEKSAADWIYAANFGAADNRAYLAGYSGKVVAVSHAGEPSRMYDVGAVPRQIIDTGSHLYILTDTRLYVLADDRLEALVDVYDRGELIVAETGFALLEPKSLNWFSPAGQVLGAVRTKDPIRRAFSTSRGLFVETRQHRAVVAGAPSWWLR